MPAPPSRAAGRGGVCVGAKVEDEEDDSDGIDDLFVMEEDWNGKE